MTSKNFCKRLYAPSCEVAQIPRLFFAERVACCIVTICRIQNQRDQATGEVLANTFVSNRCLNDHYLHPDFSVCPPLQLNSMGILPASFKILEDLAFLIFPRYSLWKGVSNNNDSKNVCVIKKVIVFNASESSCRTEQYAVNFGSSTPYIFREEINL